MEEQQGPKPKRQTILMMKIAFWCMNPEVAFTQLRNTNPRSIILTSGTLKPLKSYAKEIGVDFEF